MNYFSDVFRTVLLLLLILFFIYSVGKICLNVIRALQIFLTLLYIPEQRCSSHWYQHQANKVTRIACMPAALSVNTCLFLLQFFFP